MNFTLEIPDDLAIRLNAKDGDLSRRALEALVVDEYRNGRISKAELRRMLCFDTRYELDGFLKAHKAWDASSIDDLHRDLQDIQSLGL